MRFDGITLTEGSAIANATISRGSSFPAAPSEGELFYRNDGANEGLYVYDGAAWQATGGSFDTAGAREISGIWTFTETIVGNADTATALETGRTFSVSGDGTGTSDAFDGTAAVSIPLTLATVNSNVGSFGSSTLIPVLTVNGKGLVTAVSTAAINTSFTITGDMTGTVDGGTDVLTLATVNASPQTDAFRKVTINGKGLVTASSAVSAGDITTSLGFTPVDVAGSTMTGFLTLSADPTAGLHAATKTYVDNVASGLNVHLAVRAATTANLTATYNNGTAGVGATLTGTGTLPSIDGVTLAADDRVLVRSQSTALENGIYTVTAVSPNWVLTRAADFDNSPVAEVVAGDSTFVQEGTSLATTQWVLVTSGTISIGSTGLSFTQFGGPGSYTEGTGIDIAGTVISNTGVTSLAGTANQVVVSGASGAVTVSLPSAITIAGTMTAGTFTGSGASLTDIPNGALTNSSLTIGSTSVSLGGTAAALAGLTSVSVTAEPTLAAHLTTKNYVDTQVVSASSGLTVNVVTGTTQTAVSGAMYVMTNTGSVSTLTLPATPTVGNTVAVSNFTGRTDLVVARNGSTIMEIAEDMTIDSAKVTVTFRYINSTIGWIII